ncbi:MAG: Tim44/TimA family putative adaptor protein [Alphaproteobacteria bacterium]
MGDGFQVLDIILFAMIAAFLVLRLRSVLGRRTGHQRPPPDASTDNDVKTKSKENVVELSDQTSKESDLNSEEIDPSDPVAAGLAEIRAADPSFEPMTFVLGAKAAFEIVVQAFAEGDKDSLRGLLNNEVLENFGLEIDKREKAGETLETTVIGIKKENIIEARVNGETAFITVEILSEQVNVVRDAAGKTIDGDGNQITTVTDIWTFARNTRARDPNWRLVETRSQN